MTTAIAANDDVEIPIFSTGNHAGRDWTIADLENMVSAGKALEGKVVPTLRVGHGEQPILAGVHESEQPSLGTISSLRREGNRLLARISNVPKVVKTLLRQRRFFRLSAEIWPHLRRLVLTVRPA